MTDEPTHDTIQTAGKQAEYRRELLHATILDLQEALGPDGQPTRHSDLVAAIDRAAQTVADHVRDAEAPDGLLAEVIRVEPAYGARVEDMRREHQTMLAQADALRDGPSDRPLEDLASAVRGLIDLLDRHRHRSTELILDTYSLDLSAGD